MNKSSEQTPQIKNNSREKVEVSEVLKASFKHKPLREYTAEARKVLSALTRCRTAELGGHISRCTNCEHEEQSYNSCLNRHCPKCKGGKVYQWIEAQKGDLLAVPYFHIVFTIPEELREIFYQNKKECYNLLFKASSETLTKLGETNHKVRLGFFGVLHSWNQELGYHPHIHYVVAGGGITTEGEKSWKPIGNAKFFLPTKVLSKVFQGKLISLLKKNHSKLKFYNNSTDLASESHFNHQMSKAAKTDWIVYAKKPFSGPEVVIKYLSSYIHRVGISNSRLRCLNTTVNTTEGAISTIEFEARAKKDKTKKRIVRLTTTEFARRFLLHIVPRGYRRTRHFGYLSNSERKRSVELIRESLPAVSICISQSTDQTEEAARKKDSNKCTRCLVGKVTRMPVIMVLKAHRDNNRTMKMEPNSLFPP